MAVLSLTDWASRADPDGSTATIAEVISESNEVTTEALWLEGNLPTGHRTTQRTALPAPTWRELNAGVTPTKSYTAQVTDTCGILEAYSDVDKDLAMLNGNTASFRAGEAASFLEGMAQEFAGTFIYGNTATAPAEFLGLAPRYDTISGGTYADNIITGGGTESANTSVWLVCWGNDTVCGIFPKGSIAGLQHTDLGEVTLGDASNGYYQGYRDHFQWKCGLSLRDWRYVVRICNVDSGDLTGDASGESADVIDLMIQALHKLPNMNKPNKVFYMNRTVFSVLDRQTLNHASMNVSYGEDQHGKKVMTFRGVPVRIVDQILNTEATIS